MRDDPIFWLALIGALITAGILFTGIGGFARGGEFNRKNGNRLMRWRLIAQASAIGIVLLFVLIRG